MKITLVNILLLFCFSLHAQWGGGFNNGFATSPKNKVKGCNCEAVTACDIDNAPFKLYNVGGATAVRIVSFEDGNRIWRNNSGNDFTLDRDGVLEVSSAKGDIFYSCSEISGSGERGNSNRALLPEYLSSNVLGGTASRYAGVELSIFSLDATSATIFRNGAIVNTIALTPNNVSTFLQSGNYTGNWKIVADGKILGFKSEDTPFNGDASVMLKPSTDILGWASTSAYISKESGSATPQAFQVYSHLGNYTTGTIATTYNIVNNADLPHTSTQDDYFDPNVNIRVQSLEGLYANSRADSDGGDDTPFLPIDLLTTHHKIPQPSEYVSISNLGCSVINVFDGSGSLVTTLTPTKTNTTALAPCAVRYGTPNGATNIPQGYEFVSTEGINVVYQPKNSGAFGSDDDETVSYGYNK